MFPARSFQRHKGRYRQMTQRGKRLRQLTGGLLVALLAGCGADGQLQMPEVGRQALPKVGAMGQGVLGAIGLGRDRNAAPVAASAEGRAPGSALNAVQADGSRSDIIDGLMLRQTVLQPGPFAEVSRAVMAANSRAAEADLRAAMLRSEAQSKNWLPTLGPQISLSSLGTVAAQLVVDQVIFDNGRKKAERAMARADVEVAAVALAQDSNKRVLSALDLYLTGQAAQARASVTGDALSRMERFEYIMSERVRGGINDRADLSVVTQKVNQMRSDLARDREAAQAASGELSAMSAMPLSGISGLSAVATAPGSMTPLSVLKAEAEAKRAVETARAARAGFLPGISLNGTLAKGGNSAGLNIGVPNGLGLGTGASLRAVEAEEAAAAARVGEARETSARQLAKLTGELNSLRRERDEARGLAQEAARNYELFDAQLRAGRKTVPDVIGVFETSVRTARRAADLSYEVARVELQIAAHRGALVTGEDI